MNKLTTEWSKKIDLKNVLGEYPRPQMKRESYINLNGYWYYGTSSLPNRPEKFRGKILVPFCPESLLSGVNRPVLPGDYLWYERSFEAVGGLASEKRLLLNFQAIDQYADIYINGELVCSHEGGYFPFSVDISDHLKDGTNQIAVCAHDLTDTCSLARGKQKLEHSGMFYTPVSGIWQTVWMEEVPKSYITNVAITCDYDASKVGFKLEYNENAYRDAVTLRILDGEEEIFSDCFSNSESIEAVIKDFKPWSPQDPFLYNYEIACGEDRITGYFAMRKVNVGKDENGIPRLFLNNEPYFHNGVLDQGYWPDGLYTAPTDEALCYDIIKCKELGFNMLRKHAKIEPLRWYYHCDRLGMLVWQDIVNGGGPIDSGYVTYRPTILPFTQSHTNDVGNERLGRTEPAQRKSYEKEMEETIKLLYNSPSVVMWVLFNEGWGQFNSEAMYKKAKELDPTRTIDHASGWFDMKQGDVKSLHIYFTSFRFKRDKERPVVISEFGGYALGIGGHTMCDKSYGYRSYRTKEAFSKAYERLYTKKIAAQLKRGLCASVYTQVSDIEEEINGLLTYDRKVLKIDENVVHKMNKLLTYSK